MTQNAVSEADEVAAADWLDEHPASLATRPEANNVSEGSPSTPSQVAEVEGDVGYTTVATPETPESVRDIQADDDDMKLRNVSKGEVDESGSPEVVSSRDSVRSKGSKIANLRAAFEKSSPVDGTSRSRFGRSMERMRDRSAEREREYWREISRLRGERDKEQELRQTIEERYKKLEDKFQVLEAELEEQAQTHMNGNAHQNNSDDHVERYHEQHSAGTKSEDVSTLQQQLADLKKNISTLTRVDSHVTDSTFAQDMGVLHHELQNWIVCNFRRMKMPSSTDELCFRLEGTADFGRVALLQQIFRTFDPAAKLAFFQSAAVVFLMDVFEADFLFGMSGKQQWCAELLQAASSMRDVLDLPGYNKWRAATVDSLRQSDALQTLVRTAVENVATSICGCLCKVTGIDIGPAGKASLINIIKRAVSLAHLFTVQQAHYEFEFPRPGSALDPEMMEESAEDGDALTSPVISCTTFPAVIKFGDEDGNNLHLRNAIVKAKVLCRDAKS
ncbi:hypothetical protein B0A50_00941 [Salinomyces thailandicus]|uniref:Uncharacterized protein n=1 Tax=Salinomyces thailandicus TaxID=706561 RepID=A0A4U0UDW0_9PEZI|nr:hypothetical protein B0A50_00941 [Salinomyces thailandica]